MRRDNVLTIRGLVLLAVMLVGVVPAPPAWAGGLWMYEHGSPEVGTANAGAAARAEDASIAVNNPAGMARLERAEVMVTLQPVITDMQFQPGAGTTTTGAAGDGGVVLPTGGLFYVQPLGTDWRVGLSLGSYMGLGAKYEDDWVGRYYVQESVFLTVSAMPSISYRVTDWLSIGAGLMLQYAGLKAKLALNNTGFGSDGQMEYKGDSFGVGGGAGILIEPWKGTRFGLTYLSPVQHEFEDTPQFANAISPINQTLAAQTGQLQIKMTIPQQVMFSAYHEITPQWAVMGNFGWQNWTKFGYTGLSITSTATGATVSTTTNAQYDDTFHIAVGAHYRFHPQWRVTAGFAYDSSPVGDADRTVVLPMDRQFRYSAGLIYALNERITTGLAYTFLDAGSASVNQTLGPLAGTIQGDYSSNYIHVVALNVAMRF
ncbi:MAG: outer membrane protein transport protein (OMPP1/FadL/TodX) [candidate division NC10 bacterium]|nr:outer membrane protein transport protein (OMPP1/FadL/TodX) [candidate division NC10 bacterium]